VSRIAVVAAGAIGSSVAADLTRVGLDVMVIDQWPAHVEAMREDGLRVTMPDEDLHVAVDAHDVCDLAALKPTFDIVLLCAKSQDTKWMAQLVEPYLAGDGVLVGVQNSMNDDAHAAIVGRSRTMGCVIELSADLFTPGIVVRNTTRDRTWLAVGELDGASSDRARMLADLLAAVAVTETTTNIYGAKWTKLVANSMTMGPFGLFGLSNWEAMRLPGMNEISVALGRETVAVGQALGYRLEPIFGLSADDFTGATDEVLLRAMNTLMGHIGPQSQTAIVVDHKKGRRSEFEYISGLVVRMGEHTGVPTPYNAAVTELARRIDRGELAMEAENFQRLVDAVEPLRRERGSAHPMTSSWRADSP
jgi:2-dehydropantoate 2-reductase